MKKRPPSSDSLKTANSRLERERQSTLAKQFATGRTGNTRALDSLVNVSKKQKDQMRRNSTTIALTDEVNKKTPLRRSATIARQDATRTRNKK